MSQIIKTEAIVLRSIKYSETSKIITLYTRERGRLGAIVKGVRKKEGKFGSMLEPMSDIQVIVYVKESREVQTLAQCDLVKSFHHITGDLEKITYGFSIIEIVNSITQEQEQNIDLFELLKSSLTTLDEITVDTRLLYFYFEIKLAELLGFAPMFSDCGNCKRAMTVEDSAKWQFYSLLRGSPVCDACSRSQEGLIKISTNALSILNALHEIPKPQELRTANLDVQPLDEVDAFLTKYLQTHVHGFKPPRARKMFSQVNQ